jgi:hypothetical protein
MPPQTIHSMIATKNITGQASLPDGRWDGILGAVAFAMHATIHTTATPMQLVFFGRDAIHPIRFEADWQYIRERRQKIIIQNNDRENATQVPHIYNVNDEVMVENPQHQKIGAPRYMGPYTIHQVNDNGMVCLR